MKESSLDLLEFMAMQCLYLSVSLRSWFFVT